MATKPKVEKEEISTPEQAVKVISADAKKQLAVAAKVVIKTQEDLVAITPFSIRLSQTIKRIEELRIKFTKPLNDHVKMINAQMKEQADPFLKMQAEIDAKVLAFRKEQKAKDDAEEARKLKIREAANEKREEKGIAPIMEPVQTVERAASTVKAAEGAMTFRKNWTYEVIDPTKVPREYLTVNTTAIGIAVRQGVREIEGVRIYEEENISRSGR